MIINIIQLNKINSSIIRALALPTSQTAAVALQIIIKIKDLIIEINHNGDILAITVFVSLKMENL